MNKILPIFIRFIFISTCLLPGRYYCQNNGKLDSIKSANPQQIRTIFKTNPTSMLIGVMPIFTSEYRLLIEIPDGPTRSAQIGFSYLGKGLIILLAENDTLKKNPNAIYLRSVISGFRVQASYRFYFNDWMHAIGLSDEPIYAPRGFYLSPHISYATAKVTYKFANQYDIYKRANHFNVNLLSGCQFTLFRKFSTDLFVGVGYKQNLWYMRNQNIIKQVPPPEELEDFMKNSPLRYSGPLKISLGINFGFCF